MDASEPHQPFGSRARHVLADLSYGRVARVEVHDVNAEIVRRGGALVYRRCSHDPALLRLEQVAQEERRGLWALLEAVRMPSWEWRAWPGVITEATLAPANADDRVVAPQLLDGFNGWALGDAGYWRPTLRTALAAGGVDLLAPPRGRTAQPPRWPAWLVQTRRRVETVLSQLTGRYNAKQTRARDHWHLLGRWARKILSHTIAVLCCQQAGLPPLAFAKLVRTRNPHTGLARAVPWAGGGQQFERVRGIGHGPW